LPIADLRLVICDCSLSAEEAAIPLLQSAIDNRKSAIWWMLDLWLGAIMASLVAGWLYKD
jgi:hypothetical protein